MAIDKKITPVKTSTKSLRDLIEAAASDTEGCLENKKRLLEKCRFGDTLSESLIDAYYIRLAELKKIPAEIGKQIRAANNGNSEAAFNLAEYYEGITRAAQSDIEILVYKKQWLRFLKQATESEDPEIQYAVGRIYENMKEDGYTHPGYLRSAFEGYSAAAGMGHVEALRRLAYFYEKGLVVESNLTKATKLRASAKEIETTGTKYSYATVIGTQSVIMNITPPKKAEKKDKSGSFDDYRSAEPESFGCKIL